MEECDTLLMVGTSFPYIEFSAETGPGARRADRSRPGAHRLALSGGGRPGRRLPAHAATRCCRCSSARRIASFLEKAQQGMAEWWELMEERGTRDGQADEAAGGRLGARQAACATTPLCRCD